MNIATTSKLVVLACFATACGGSDAAPASMTTGGYAGAAAGASGSSGGGGPSTGGGGSSAGGSAGAIGNAGAPAAGGMGPSTSSSRFTAKTIGGSNTAPNGFYEYLPPGYDGSAAAPLLVFWHGIGQDGNGGSDLMNVPAYGPPHLIQGNLWPDARPFIVLSPQYTATNGDIAPGGGCPSSAVVDAFFVWAIANYKVDPKRTFLTGLSCGAVGSWDYLGSHPGTTVAAAVLISGNPGDPTTAGSVWQRAGCALGATAIWSLHGDADTVVPYAPDHDTMQNLIACPSPPRQPAIFTDVVNGSHGIWDPIYDLTSGYGDIYQWLLNNAKP